MTVYLNSPDVVAATSSFNGHDYPMVSNGNLWYVLIGVGQAVGSVEMIHVGDYPIVVRYQLSRSRAVLSSTLMLSVTPTEFPVDDIEVGEETAELLAPELEAAEAAQLNQAYSGFTPTQFWRGAFVMPVQGEITTNFGARRSYQGGPVNGSHAGVDIGVNMGTPVAASAAGKVAWVGELPDRGNGVIIDHGLGVFTGYFHLSRIIAHRGQIVTQGEIIGLAGSTGLSTGPHVHWEIAISETNVDGLQFMHTPLPEPAPGSGRDLQNPPGGHSATTGNATSVLAADLPFRRWRLYGTLSSAS